MEDYRPVQIRGTME